MESLVLNTKYVYGMFHFEVYILSRMYVIIIGLCYILSNLNENGCALAIHEPFVCPGNREGCLSGGFCVFE